MRTSVGSHSDVGEFLRKLHRYDSQPLDTKRCNYCYLVGALRRWRTAPGSIVKGLKPRRGVACYRELPRIPLLRTWVNKDKERKARAARPWLVAYRQREPLPECTL